MAMKFFTNAFEGNASTSIAINSRHVVSVFETILTNSETNEVTQSTSIFTVNGIQFQVTDSYLDVIARLNEQ